MAGRVDLQWFGPRVHKAVLNATEAAINDVTEKAVEATQAPHRTGQLQSEVVAEPARREGRKISGRFGSTKHRGFYGLFQERRRPFLRPAADSTFPGLSRAIARRLSSK